MQTLIDRLAQAAKAITAAAVPGVTLLVSDLSDAVSAEVTGIVTVVAALVLTYLVPNRPAA